MKTSALLNVDNSALDPSQGLAATLAVLTKEQSAGDAAGLVDNPNENSQKEVLIKYGLTVDDAISKFRLYFGWQEAKR